jgi:hypothetical protein
VVERNLDRLHPGARWFMEEGLRVTLDGYLAARRRRFGYVRELDELLGEDGIVLSPTIGNRPVPGPGPPTATSRSTPASRDNNLAYVLDTKVAAALQLPITR